jgi:NAD(P)-dependent dehydrogenase (short-subunit alcohol dehydrogenase family)
MNWRKITTAAAGIALSAIAVRAATKAARRCDFKNKVVVVSGGSRGLGLVLARRLAEEGAKLVLLARDEEKLRQAKVELEALGAEVFVKACDVTSQAEAENAIAEAVMRFRAIDVLINVAGIIQVGSMETMTTADYEEAMRVHFWGPLYLTLAVVPAMKQRRHGRIVNISSIGGKISVPHMLPYCASKFALVGLHLSGSRRGYARNC